MRVDGYLAMTDDSHSDNNGSIQDAATGGGGADSRAAAAESAAPRSRLSPLVIAMIGASALALIFFLAPVMMRVRAAAGQGGGGQASTAQNGDEPAGKPGELPLGPRQDVALGDAPVRGSRNAPVMIIEFADFQCPYCQQMHPELKILQQELAGKVAVAFKDFPLAMHANAEKAAEAARCAGEQGKYWDFHDELFHNSENLEVAQLKQFARDLKLNQPNFDACLDSGKEAAAVQKDLAQGRQLGVRATPSFFFNGRLFTGAMDYFTLRSLVETLLKTDAPAAAGVRGAAWRGAAWRNAGAYDVGEGDASDGAYHVSPQAYDSRGRGRLVLASDTGGALGVRRGSSLLAPRYAAGDGHPSQVEQGKTVFENNCTRCHVDGDAPPLEGVFKNKTLPSGAAATDENVRNKVLHGGDVMPSYEGRLGAAQIDALLAYLHTL